MTLNTRSNRNRALRPNLAPLEERALLNAALPYRLEHSGVGAQLLNAKQNHVHQLHVKAPTVTGLGKVTAGGFAFTNFDGPDQGTNAGAGTNMNGISNSGTAVGFSIDNNGNFNNFVANPLKSRNAKLLNINGSTTANAFAVNSRGTVVGTDGNGNAFFVDHGAVKTFIPNGGMSALALGVSDHGTIVGQYSTSTASPGFIRVSGKSFITINAPSGPNTVNAQGINNHGEVVGFYVGTDGQDHGFMANERTAHNGSLTGVAIADPVIPAVPGEPGATFVFSQVLGINDHGIAVGYYGDSTTSQHGFLYNTNTGKYTFLDDPSETFNGGVEVTQITGITNSGEITGFYSDASGVFHGFVATVAQGKGGGHR
jgi:uncharacterized membrane protein